MTEHLLVYLGLVVVPSAAFYGARLALEWFTGWPGLPRRRPAVPAQQQVDLLVRHLRRLDEEYARIEQADVAGKATRLRTVSLAYDDTLRDCCAVVGLPTPGRPPLPASSRLQAEAALAQRGVTW